MSKALATKNVAAVLLALSLALGVSFAFAGSANAQTTNASTLATLQAQVQALLAQIAALQGTGTTGSASGGACFTFTATEHLGTSGSEVMWIQEFLNGHGFQVAASGAGSPGNETSYFGGLTKAAVAKWQAANNVSPAAGYWGPLSRAKANSICAGATTGTTGGTTTGTTSGTGITVTAGAQPANSLAPQGASRVPFTTFTLTNNSGAAVTINGVTVQRTGLAQDAAFSGVELVDSNGVQVGIAHTFNSNHQATIGDTMTLNPGQSVTYTVAGNMASDEGNYAGEVAAVSVTGVNTSVPVSGSLPISGAQQVVNATLSIGSFSTSTSAFDPGIGANPKKNIGDTGVNFTGIRFTAGSAEDVKLYSIRWREVGTASASDISNVVTVVNGTSYPTTVDSSGRYYTSVFPGGISIAKGNTIDAYIKGDITGSNSAGQTVQFNIDKNTDVYFVGQTYGYGVTDLGCGGAQCTNTPWLTGDQTQIQAGTATTISNSTKVAAQNVAPGVQNQPLGGFMTNFTGEPVSITGMTVNYATTSATVGLLTNVSIVDENGNVVAGPVDATANGDHGKLTYTDSITFPVGVHYYTIQGKLPTTADNNATIQLDTNPSQWTSPTGQTSGNTVSLSQGDFTMNTMTVKAGSLTVSISSTPVAQNIIAGSQNLVFSNIVLDASQSGEDVRLNSIGLTENGSSNAKAGAHNMLSTCQLYDGSTALNGGSNVVNGDSTATTTSATQTTTFTFDNSLVIPKGTVKTLAVECNVSSSADESSTFQWGITSAQISNLAVTGVTSGTSITATGTQGSGQLMTVASNGSLTATAASTAVAQPALSLVPAGTTGVTMGSVKFHASNEDIKIQKIGLTLDHGTAGSKSQGAAGNSGHTAKDNVVTAYIYDGSTLVGTAVFTGSTATSTLSTPVTVSANTDKTLTIKADLSSIGVSQAGGIGDVVTVDPLNVQGLGLASSQQVNISATAGVNGVQMFKSVPTVALGTGACSGTGCNGSNQVIKAITVTANATGPVSVEQLKFDIATSSAALTNANVSVYDASGNVASSTFGAEVTHPAFDTSGTLTYTGGPVIIPAGQTYTFKLTGTVTPQGSNTNWSVNATLEGDSSAISGIGLTPSVVGTTTAVANQDTESGFVWSDDATTTATLTDVDWFNGFQVNGLPSIGL